MVSSRNIGRNSDRKNYGAVQTDAMQNSTGTIAVQVFIADRAIPVEDANVIISRQLPKDSEELIRILKTDASGITETVELPAPPEENSLVPGNSDNFYTYNIRVDKPGYYTIENRNVPVFAGNKSIQPVAMIPLPEGEEKGKKITFTEEAQEELE